MKRVVPLLLFLFLSGCTFRETSRLRSVETLGVDYDEGIYTLSISTGEGTELLPGLLLTASGSSMEGAMTALEAKTDGKELFYAHVRYIILGENGAEALPGLLDCFERSPELRMNLPLYWVRGRAEDPVTDEEKEVGGLLHSLERSGKESGVCQVPTLLECARSWRKGGYALCAAMGEEGLSGYALLQPGKKVRTSTALGGIGITLMEKGLEFTRLTIPLSRGYAAIETTEYRPQKDTVCRYALLELRGEADEEELNAAVAAYLSAAAAEGCAFLGSEAPTETICARLYRGYDLTRSDAP